ncbi:MAG: PepSY domain-containing protein, partial [Verrucomicrobiae bacterium]|nr:PepSY domain-containing protein [Verrucomicrobiae bacterium]
MTSPRKILFWAHLVAGVAAGVVIAVMALTGSVLAFEKELVAWSEREARRIVPAAPGTSRLPIEEVLARVRERAPGGNPGSVTIYADPSLAIAVGYGRTNTYYVDPTSGDVREPESRGMRNFMQVMLSWHRWLGRDGDQRAW